MHLTKRSFSSSWCLFIHDKILTCPFTSITVISSATPFLCSLSPSACRGEGRRRIPQRFRGSSINYRRARDSIPSPSSHDGAAGLLPRLDLGGNFPGFEPLLKLLVIPAGYLLSLSEEEPFPHLALLLYGGRLGRGRIGGGLRRVVHGGSPGDVSQARHVGRLVGAELRGHLLNFRQGEGGNLGIGCRAQGVGCRVLGLRV